jgi:hypothetical protein
MDLSDSAVPAALLAETNSHQRQHNSARIPKVESGFWSVYEAPAHKAVNRRCKCGNCYKCLEAARWESVFQKKFADPFYYSSRGLPQSSPF